MPLWKLSALLWKAMMGCFENHYRRNARWWLVFFHVVLEFELWPGQMLRQLWYPPSILIWLRPWLGNAAGQKQEWVSILTTFTYLLLLILCLSGCVLQMLLTTLLGPPLFLQELESLDILRFVLGCSVCSPTLYTTWNKLIDLPLIPLLSRHSLNLRKPKDLNNTKAKVCPLPSQKPTGKTKNSAGNSPGKSQ